MDRLTRFASFLETIVKSSVPVVFRDLPGIEGAVGNFILKQMANIAQLEAELIFERTKAALRAKVERDGQWDRKARHHLVPGAGQKVATEAVQAKAKARAIVVIMNSGISSYRGIAKELNARDIKTARGGRWQAVQVKRVLETWAG